MIINQANLADLFTAFRVQFKQGFEGFQQQSLWQRIATRVPSSTRDNHYAWLGQWPQLREWIGDRHLKGLAAHDYRIVNRKFESTIEVPRDDIEDDQFGIYSMQANGMGLAAAQHPDELIFALLLNGFTELSYDGKAFFATDHPVGEGTASNSGGGGGTPWFLFDAMKALKPMIFQVRRDYDFKMMTRPDDENVFMRDTYRYGVDARVNVGFAFWQQAYGSKQTLDKNAYAAAREGMMGLKSDEGRPLGIKPNVLVVPPALEGEALEILNAERDAAGATNVYKGTAELVVVPWLA
ncbi:MAG TPA: Mu-like prophage major head subunit gpT family protein [bacterium]|jgi:phage major head subunit gpT-like protein